MGRPLPQIRQRSQAGLIGRHGQIVSQPVFIKRQLHINDLAWLLPGKTGCCQLKHTSALALNIITCQGARVFGTLQLDPQIGIQVGPDTFERFEFIVGVMLGIHHYNPPGTALNQGIQTKVLGMAAITNTECSVVILRHDELQGETTQQLVGPEPGTPHRAFLGGRVAHLIAEIHVGRRHKKVSQPPQLSGPLIHCRPGCSHRFRKGNRGQQLLLWLVTGMGRPPLNR